MPFSVELIFSDHAYDSGPVLEAILLAGQDNGPAIQAVMDGQPNKYLFYKKTVEIDPGQGLPLKLLDTRPLPDEYIGLRVIYAVDADGGVTDILGHMNHWDKASEFLARNEGKTFLFNVLPPTVATFKGCRILVRT